MPDHQDMTPGLVSVDELLEIVTDAGLLHQRDLYETSLSHLIVKGGDPFGDLSTARELAEALGIPEERLKAAIENRYPPTDDQLAALETQDAIATTRAVARTYQVELLRILRKALPSRQFEAVLEKAGRLFDQPYLATQWQRDYTVRILVIKESQAQVRPRPSWRHIFTREKAQDEMEPRRDEILLASIQVGIELLPHALGSQGRSSTERLHRGSRLCIVTTIGSGVFIKLCNTQLSALRERFDRHNGVVVHDVLYDYVVQEADQLG